MRHATPQLRAPLIILSPPRSFSSVICAMIGQHPQLYSFPELNLFLADTLESLSDFEQTRSAYAGRAEGNYLAGLLRAIAELLYGGQTSETISLALGWIQARRGWSTRGVFDFLLDRVWPRIGVDKSPRTALSRKSLQRAQAFYPQARFLHLTRHPVSTQQSMQESHRRFSLQTQTQASDATNLANYYARLWCFAHQAILDFMQTLPPDRTMRLQGEALLCDPDQHLPLVAEWLGVRDDQTAIAAMKHPERSPYARSGPEGVRGENDPKFLEEPYLRPASLPPGLNFPQEWNLDHSLKTKTIEVAKRLGYG